MNLKRKRGLCPNCKSVVIVKEIKNERCPYCGTYLTSKRIEYYF